MSTRSNIGIENNDGTVTFVYCHHDGYLAGVGQTLLDNYTTEEEVRALLAPGDMSACYARCDLPQRYPAGAFAHSFKHPTKGHCIYYGRDRGELGIKAQTKHRAEAEDEMDNVYAYIFKGGAWAYRYNYADDPTWLPLTREAIAAEVEE